MGKTSVDHMPEPGAKWEFDRDVTEVFDDMFARSIPGYETMRDLVFEIGKQFVLPKTTIIDIGSSRGGSVQALVDRFGAQNSYVLCEISEPMVEVLEQKFKGFVDCGILEIWRKDLRDGLPSRVTSLVQAVLTLQFIPINYRHRIIQDAYDGLAHGGAMIVVEKVLGTSAILDDLFVESYERFKNGAGYSAEAVARKRAALEGVLVPVTAKWNEEALQAAGFRSVECFWRNRNFAAWVAIK